MEMTKYQLFIRLKMSALLFCLLTSIPAWSQPSWTKKATKSVFTLKTFNAEGALIGSSNGFFVNEQGDGVSCFSPFKGASRAVVIDGQGNEMEVKCMLGANDTYDVAKFRVVSKKTTPLPMATTQAAVGTNVWLLPYREAKSLPQGTIQKGETFMEEHTYYTVSMAMPDNTMGCPLINEAGEVVGLMQQPYKQGDTLSYAVSAQFANSLAINGLSMNSSVLRSTNIKKDLPDDVSQAALSLYLGASSLDSVSYVTLIEDFISKFPNAPDGYEYRAQQEVAAGLFDAAAQDMEKAIKVSEKKDETHFNYSKLILNKEVYMSEKEYKNWSLDMALAEAQEAEKINPLPMYRHQQGVILYALKKYDEAYNAYASLFNSELRDASLFYEASRCKEMLHDSTAVLELLDSCVAMFERPYLKEAAPYLIVRAQARLDKNLYRDAVNDFNDYEALMPTTLTDRFFYMRHQAEIGGRLYQQALNDIDKAIEMSPTTDLYYGEKASLQIRVGQYQEAQETGKEMISKWPEQSDGYLFLGMAQCLKGQKAEGVKNLQKAGELGDTQAASLIDKYGK